MPVTAIKADRGRVQRLRDLTAVPCIPSSDSTLGKAKFKVVQVRMEYIAKADAKWAASL